jgi:hypothetical protein
MCSEAEPFDCHRFSMISNQLEKEGLDVRHILKDKLIKTNADLEEDLIKKYKRRLPQPDIFNPDISYQDQLEVAYRLRNKDIAFSPYSKQTVQELYD